MPNKKSFPRDNNRSSPRSTIEQDLRTIYEQNDIAVGGEAPQTQKPRSNTIAIVGIALGDEGKGRIVDNTIETLLKKLGIKQVAVIRFQGGNNAGHTVEKGGIKLALHLVPSFVFHKKAIGIMDRGMLVDIEDLETEVAYVENAVGSLKGRLFLSDDALLCTDLERAEEALNAEQTASTKGGTGRGIGPGYAHHYDKAGLRISDLLDSVWEDKLAKKYGQYEKLFRAFGMKLADVEVPDFAQTVKIKKASKRQLGSKAIFLKRLETARSWLLKRNIVVNTYHLHLRLSADTSVAIVFEGAQAAGLDAWTGTRPDVTSTNTTVYGVREGTAFWRMHDIEQRIGILKVPYTSSVGSRRMPTHIDLPANKRPTTDAMRWAAFIREEAYEYGTTTGRPRDINFLDLPFISYNVRMAGITAIMTTHLDVCREEDSIKIATHYTDKKGDLVVYQPGLRYLKDVKPSYIEIPGWDGRACQKAKKPNDLPAHALKFLALLQTRLGLPIIATTTGPDRTNFISF